MKTLKCKDMGGTCDHPMTADTSEEMMNKGMAHLNEAHPEMAKSVEEMPKDDPVMVEWYKKFMQKWEATPINN